MGGGGRPEGWKHFNMQVSPHSQNPLSIPSPKQFSVKAISPRKSALIFPCFPGKLPPRASIKAALVIISLFPACYIDMNPLKNRDRVSLFFLGPKATTNLGM